MIKLTIALLMGLVAVAALRKSSAALRHWLLTVSILCAALMPGLERVVPTWHLPYRGAGFWSTDRIPLEIPRPRASVEPQVGAMRRRPAIGWCARLRSCGWPGLASGSCCSRSDGFACRGCRRDRNR